MVYVIQFWWKLSRNLSANPYDTHHCCVYSEKKSWWCYRGTVRNMWSFIPKINFEKISAYSWFNFKNYSQLFYFNILNTEINPFCHLLALLGTHHIFHVSRLRAYNNYQHWTLWNTFRLTKCPERRRIMHLSVTLKNSLNIASRLDFKLTVYLKSK